MMKSGSPIGFFTYVFDYLLMLILLLFLFSSFWERTFFLIGEESFFYILFFALIVSMFFSHKANVHLKNTISYKANRVIQVFFFGIFWVFSFFALVPFVSTGWKRALVSIIVAFTAYALNRFLMENVLKSDKGSA